MTTAEKLAKAFHEAYEDLAPQYINTHGLSVPWDKFPENNKKLMIAVCERILDWSWKEISIQDRQLLLGAAAMARLPKNGDEL